MCSIASIFPDHPVHTRRWVRIEGSVAGTCAGGGGSVRFAVGLDDLGII